MLGSLPVAIIVGTILGFLAGLGIGGGSLLILWLTLALQMDPQTARLVNLLFFIPSAIISSLFRWKQGALDLPRIFHAILSGCVSALVCSLIFRSMEPTLLRRLFGILLLITGTRVLFYKPPKK